MARWLQSQAAGHFLRYRFRVYVEADNRQAATRIAKDIGSANFPDVPIQETPSSA